MADRTVQLFIMPEELIERVNSFAEAEGWSFLVAGDKKPNRLVKRKRLDKADLERKWDNLLIYLVPPGSNPRNATRNSVHLAKMGLVQIYNPPMSSDAMEPTHMGVKSDWRDQNGVAFERPEMLRLFGRLKRFMLKGTQNNMFIYHQDKPEDRGTTNSSHYSSGAIAWYESGKQLKQTIDGKMYYGISE